MKRITILAFVCFAALLIGCNSNVHEYFVSNSGEDATSGTSPEKAWKSIEKVNATSFEPDPGLTDPGKGGTINDATQLTSLSAYLLKESSVLIDQGLDIKSTFGIDPGPHDFYGVLVPENEKFDVGAAEYNSSNGN